VPDPETRPATYADQFAALRKQYTRQLGGTLDELARQVREQGPGMPRTTLEDIHASLHKLAGSGGTFGFPELTRQARALESTAKSWLDTTTAPEEGPWTEWRDSIVALHQSVDLSDIVPMVMTQSAPPAIKPHDHVRVAVIDDDLIIGAELSQGLRQFGYEVAHYPGFATAEPALLAAPPDILVVDVMLPGEVPPDGTLAIPPLFERLGRRLPTIFMTSRLDLPARLSVVRAGGDAFLTKPVDAPTLAGRIETLLRVHEQPPYRILIVDDDEVLAEHYRLALSGAGMLAIKICEPLKVLDTMHSLHPDLILMDLYMPECSGADLARALRFDDMWQTVPIVFLSSEEDLDQQIKAISRGGDDFLTKPISDKRLVAAVLARARRARQVAELMSQDSLTGLLKHASIKERLVQEASSAQRRDKPLAVVMVDIDLFKQVNDDWGHPMGDQVIKTLGNLLRQCLRRQDSVGRYGGEEFAAILPDCSSADAVRLIDDIRRRFSEIRFVHEGRSFSVTFSAGVASSEHHADAQGLLAAADLALYEAKHHGRNQVRLAQASQEGQA
jgi:diguanylate cyclase (GGDEF)-like protein